MCIMRKLIIVVLSVLMTYNLNCPVLGAPQPIAGDPANPGDPADNTADPDAFGSTVAAPANSTTVEAPGTEDPLAPIKTTPPSKQTTVGPVPTNQTTASPVPTNQTTASPVPTNQTTVAPVPVPANQTTIAPLPTITPSTPAPTNGTTTPAAPTVLPTGNGTLLPPTGTPGTPGTPVPVPTGTQPIPTGTASPMISTTPIPVQRFDPASFIGGIVLCGGLVAVVFFGCKFYRARNDRNYHTL